MFCSHTTEDFIVLQNNSEGPERVYGVIYISKLMNVVQCAVLDTV